MAIGDLNPAVWRIDVYELKPDSPFAGVIADLSNLYTSDLTITKQRNYPDEIRFTLDLQQLENRATSINKTSRELLEPYRHKIRCYRNNEFVAQGIVIKTTVNLNNNAKNTVEVQCADTLTLLEKRLIHQDYGEGSWADFAKNVIYDAQHEPNRIYNYAWEGDGISINNAWFRGWKYLPGLDTLRDYPEWEPNKLYSMYDTCTHEGKFWEAKEHAFYSGETWSSSNWTLLGILDQETGEVSAAYGVWREDDEEPGPTGTALGGWGGTSSCHMTSRTMTINNGSGGEISMKDSTVSSTLTAPYQKCEGAPRLPQEYQEVEYLESSYGKTSANELGPYIDTKINAKAYSCRLKYTLDHQIASDAATTHWHVLLGVSNGMDNGTWTWPPQFNFALNSAGQYALEYAYASSGSSASIVGPVWSANRKTIVLDALSDIPSFTVNGSTYTGTTARGDDVGPNANIFVFARSFVSPSSSYYQNGSFCAPMKLYSLKIEDSRRVLRDYVPCRRKSDNTPGLYDLITGTFFTNAGTGNFTVGSNVLYEDEYEKNSFVVDTSDVTETHSGAEAALTSIDYSTLETKFEEQFPEILDEDIYPIGVYFDSYNNGYRCRIKLSATPTNYSSAWQELWIGSSLTNAKETLTPWGIIIDDGEGE